MPQRRLADITPLTWRPLTRDDLGELSELLTAIEHLDDPAGRHSLDDLIELVNQHRSDPATSTIAGRFGESLVAFGWNVVMPEDIDPRRVWLMGGVHPGWRDKRIGRLLLTWQFEQARAWYRETREPDHGQLAMLIDVDEKLSVRRDLYERAGMLPRQWLADMHCAFDSTELVDVPAPRGIRLVLYDASYAERARNAHNDAFAGLWGAQEVSGVEWQESMSRTSARPEWSWLALDGDLVVGYAINSAHPQDWAAQGFSEGWTDRLGVRPEYRGRGIAKALLAASMRTFRAAGLDGAGLGVDSDNPTGAVGLYRALGYVSADTVIRYLRTETIRAAGKSKKKS